MGRGKWEAFAATQNALKCAQWPTVIVVATTTTKTTNVDNVQPKGSRDSAWREEWGGEERGLRQTVIGHVAL